LKLLKQTREYAEFAGFVEDSGGNVRGVVEDGWLPGEAYNLAHGFREEHGSELTPQLVNQLLSDLNRIWSERERKQLLRVKQQAAAEIA
jgi:hypothetical protein